MSYDLRLFRVPDEGDALLTYQQLMQQEELEITDLDAWLKRPVPEPERAEMQRIANALKLWWPSLEEFRPKSPLPWIELNDEDLQIQFNVCDRTVNITMPYFGDQAEKMFDCVAGCFDTLKAAAGYIAYDPQLGRVVTSADLEEMAAQYRRMDDALPGILANGDFVPTKKKPWWKIW